AALGQADSAAAVLAEARPLVRHGPFAAMAPLVAAGEAQVSLARGDATTAAAHAAEAEPASLPDLASLADIAGFGAHVFGAGAEAVGITAARILAAQGRAVGDTALLRQAEARLETARELAERQGLGWLRLKALILQALVADGLGDRAAALAALAAAV